MSMPINTGLVNPGVLEERRKDFEERWKSGAIKMTRMGKMTKDGVEMTEEERARQDQIKAQIEARVHKVEDPVSKFKYGDSAHDYGKLDIDGVIFSRKEVNDISAILRPSFSNTMNCKVYYNYSDYGEMGIAEGAAATYCRKNLTEEQGAVVQKYVARYFDQMSGKQNALLNTEAYKTSEEIDFPGNKYYNIWHGTDYSDPNERKAALEAQREYQKALGRGSRYQEPIELIVPNQDKKNPNISWSSVNWATDKETISFIRQIFRNMDVTDEDSVQNAMNQYREKMGQVYSYKGYTSASNADYDISGFMEQLANRRAALNRCMGGGINTVV